MEAVVRKRTANETDVTRAVNPLTYRLNDLAIVFAVSRRTIERALSAGRFPQSNLHIGKRRYGLGNLSKNGSSKAGGNRHKNILKRN